MTEERQRTSQMPKIVWHLKFKFTALLNGLAGLQVMCCFHHLSSFALCQGNFAQAIKPAFRVARHPSLNELVQRGANCASISVPGTRVTDDFMIYCSAPFPLLFLWVKFIYELLLPGQRGL